MGGAAVVGMTKKRRAPRRDNAAVRLDEPADMRVLAERLLTELDAVGPDWPYNRIMEDPGIFFGETEREWSRTNNPYWVWSTIKFCAANRVEYPSWVYQYLADCARRMLSDDAVETSDLRKTLPTTMGFSLERGRGHPLNPERVGKKYFFCALIFGFRISKGATPKEALKSAFEVLDRDVADKMDDKTLLSHIKKIFGLSHAPRTSAEWKRVIYPWMIVNFSAFVPENREIPSRD
jgi:hypothetical protein